ncbi:hypothetical protein [Nitrospirillum iridis]|uniref:Uncharacterized protein n=1 Tax=Nitrospirillum iridis TaxID=765888 RepID=A0A7X0EEH6_9PROT|nr:hypothetical protein [Nitrospirillum iridis]MBB6253035.1 hypothetical protein [Nitrospirillum iridis]
MFDPTKPVQTRDGRAVEIVYRNVSGEYPLAGIVTERDGTKRVELWTREGNDFVGQECDSPDDLVNVPEAFKGSRRVLINVYANGAMSAHRDSGEAHRRAYMGAWPVVARTTAIIEWTEGVFAS